MIRTVISLDDEDKAWLDRKAREDNVAMTEVIRRAVRRLREESGSENRSLDELLRQTRGLWKNGDGLAYQRKLRREWKRGK
ncbi:MAG: ribbon-helix-helix protein, CopG family [Burkholderiales bacterium]